MAFLCFYTYYICAKLRQYHGLKGRRITDVTTQITETVRFLSCKASGQIFHPPFSSQPDQEYDSTEAQFRTHGHPYAFQAHGGSEPRCQRDSHGPDAEKSSSMTDEGIGCPDEYAV